MNNWYFSYHFQRILRWGEVTWAKRMFYSPDTCTWIGIKVVKKWNKQVLLKRNKVLVKKFCIFCKTRETGKTAIWSTRKTPFPAHRSNIFPPTNVYVKIGEYPTIWKTPDTTTMSVNRTSSILTNKTTWGTIPFTPWLPIIQARTLQNCIHAI